MKSSQQNPSFFVCIFRLPAQSQTQNTTAAWCVDFAWQKFIQVKIYPSKDKYWYSWTSPNLPQGLNSNDDVTCIAMQRRLILCGTLYGSLLIFSADSGTESNTSSKSVRTVSNNSNININNNNNNKINTLRKSRKLPPKHSKLEFDSKPLAKLKVSNSAIVQVSKS